MSRPPRRARFGHRLVFLGEIQFFRKVLLGWYATSGRHFPWRLARATRFHQVVSEVLLQRTRAEAVAAFWPAFLLRFPSWRSLADASVEEIEEFLKPIGLAAQRAPRLNALAAVIAARNGRFPAARDKIEALPGVGQYVANAVLLFCFGKPQPLVDVNMARVLERFFGARKMADIRYDPYLQELAYAVVAGDSSRELNWSILDLGAKVCTASAPCCGLCPLLARCRYANSPGARAHRLRPRKPDHS